MPVHAAPVTSSTVVVAVDVGKSTLATAAPAAVAIPRLAGSISVKTDAIDLEALARRTNEIAYALVRDQAGYDLERWSTPARCPQGGDRTPHARPSPSHDLPAVRAVHHWRPVSREAGRRRHASSSAAGRRWDNSMSCFKQCSRRGAGNPSASR